MRIDYEALRSCLNAVAAHTDSPVVMPKIGAGLGGGDWTVIEKIIDETLGARATVYEL